MHRLQLGVCEVGSQLGSLFGIAGPQVLSLQLDLQSYHVLPATETAFMKYTPRLLPSFKNLTYLHYVSTTHAAPRDHAVRIGCTQAMAHPLDPPTLSNRAQPVCSRQLLSNARSKQNSCIELASYRLRPLKVPDWLLRSIFRLVPICMPTYVRTCIGSHDMRALVCHAPIRPE